MQKINPAKLSRVSISGLYATVMLLLSCGCNDEPKPNENTKTIPIDKHASVDVKIHQENIGDKTVISFDKTFYNDSGTIVKQLISYDTVPLLNIVGDTLDTGKTFVNANGNEEEKDTIILHPRLYQFFVTIK